MWRHYRQRSSFFDFAVKEFSLCKRKGILQKVDYKIKF